MTADNPVRRAHLTDESEEALVVKLEATVGVKDSALTVLFCSSSRNRGALQEALSTHCSGGTIIGCTTAGEIGCAGFSKNSVSAMTFSKSDFKVSVGRMQGLKEITADDATELVTRLMRDLASQAPGSLDGKCFALLLIDGLALAEEPLAYKLQHALGNIPLVGGSAGDDLEFSQTQILCDGTFNRDTAVLALIYTERPWEAFKEQHFRPSDVKAVVTEADPDTRTVMELNAEPAAEEFARMLGLAGPEELNSDIFAGNPLMVQLSGSWYIRSVQKANSDGSLTIYCAIDEGMVLCLGINENLVSHLNETFAGIRDRLGEVKVTFASDCIQRKQELERLSCLDEAARVLEMNRSVGFSTYGEQFGALHINQTLTGIAIG